MDGAKGGNSGWLFLLCNLQRESHLGEPPVSREKKMGKRQRAREKEKKVKRDANVTDLADFFYFRTTGQRKNCVDFQMHGIGIS